MGCSSSTAKGLPPSYMQAINLQEKIDEKKIEGKEKQLKMFNDFATRFSISNNFIAKFQAMRAFKVVLICDDSGSMRNDAYICEFATMGTIGITRFDELKTMVKLIVESTKMITNSDIDIVFMNRKGKKNISTFDDIKSHFTDMPDGYTPLADTLRKVVSDNEEYMKENNLIIYILTDGSPTTTDGYDDKDTVRRNISAYMQNFRNLYMTFMMCVSDEDLLDFADKIGQQHKRVGVVDEFNVEVKEMKERGINMSYGDYVTKALLVAIDPDIKKQF